MLAALNDSTQAMACARVAMRRGRAIMRLQRIQLRRARRAQWLLCALSIAQSLSIAAFILSSCNGSEHIDAAPVCEIAIDHARGVSETRGDCDAGEW